MSTVTFMSHLTRRNRLRVHESNLASTQESVSKIYKRQVSVTHRHVLQKRLVYTFLCLGAYRTHRAAPPIPLGERAINVNP